LELVGEWEFVLMRAITYWILVPSLIVLGVLFHTRVWSQEAAPNMRVERAPDGHILPSERSVGERLGCGVRGGPLGLPYMIPWTHEIVHLPTDACFFPIPLSAAERETLRHAMWANDIRRDDYLRARRARIIRDMDQATFPIYDATERGWVKRNQVMYSFSLPEFIFAAHALSNARYCNQAQPEPFAEEVKAVAYLCAEYAPMLNDNQAGPYTGGRAGLLFQKFNATRMGGM
jgi:hypothetical protein